MWNILLWLYIANATLLITHEIDSAFWREWEIFHLPGSISGFLLMHLPLIFLILVGLTWTVSHSPAGLIMSLILTGCGLFAFIIHSYHLHRGRQEFRNGVSIGILAATLLTSFAQGIVALRLLV